MPRRRIKREMQSAVPWAPALAVAGLAAVVLGWTAGSYPVIGESAVLLDKHLWLEGMPPATHPIWGLLVRGLARLVPGAPVAALNAFSVICGTGAAALFYYLSARLLEMVGPGRRRGAYVLSGLSSAAFLILSLPFWLVCSRAHPLSFDMLLLMTAVFLQSEYQRKGRISYLFAFGFVYGIGLVEYPTFALLAWPLGVVTLLLMRKRGHLRRSRRRRNLVRGAASVCAGVLLAVIATGLALAFSPARSWMEAGGWLRIFRILPSAAWAELLQGFPRTGWILIGMVSVVPWGVCLLETHRRSSVRHLPSVFLYLVLTGLTLTVLFNGLIAPFAVMKNTSPVVMPYVFVASTFGMLVDYWRAAFSRLWERQHWHTLWVRNGLIAVLPATLGAAVVTGWPHVRQDRTRVFYDAATEMLDALGDRTWLATDGSLDSLLRLAGLDQGRRVELFSLRDGFEPAYRRLLVTRFEDARHRSLAELGALPLLREEIRTNPATVDKLAFQNSGALWLEAGYEPLPERLVYGGRKRDAPLPDAAEVLERHAHVWGDLAPRLRQVEEADPALGPLARHLRRQISRVANDLGVMLDRAGEVEEARIAYREARAADELNASAIVNLAGAGDTNGVDKVRDELDLPIPLLVARYGHIQRLGDLGALRGAADDADAALQEWIRERFAQVEARYREGDGPGCLDALAEILRDDPDLSIAWYLQGLLAARFGNADAFEQSWQYMTRQERAWPALLMIRGEHLLRDGQTSAGLSLYEKAFDLNPYDSRIVWQVAVAEFTHGSPVHAERYVTQLLSLEPGNPWGNFALGAIQFSRGNYDLAESSLRVASERLDIPDAENNLAWLLHLNGRHEEAEAHARAALALDDQFAPAWDTLGAIQMQGGDRAGARTAYRRALELDPVSWDARVHLAQLAWAEGRELEAAKLVRELEPDSLGKSSPELADYRALRHELRMPVMTSE